MYHESVSPKATSLVYSILVAVTTVTVGWAWFNGLSGRSSSIPGSGVRILRDVNVERILRQVQEGRLSDHEALYYRRTND